MGRTEPYSTVGVAKEREVIMRLSSCWWSWFILERKRSEFMD